MYAYMLEIKYYKEICSISPLLVALLHFRALPTQYSTLSLPLQICILKVKVSVRDASFLHPIGYCPECVPTYYMKTEGHKEKIHTGK